MEDAMLPKRADEKGKDVEKDLGFGPSHGYGKSHGGPSGPGDVPAKPSPKTPAKSPPSKKRKAAQVSDAFRLECRDSQRTSFLIGGLGAT
ncbi:MAG: hypothetical protein ABI461_01115 [Polyangiaceae bacterium]